MSDIYGNDIEYDEDGRLLGATISIGVYSPGGGGIDPTTGRDYGLLCQNIENGEKCHSKMFYEDENGMELKCKVCHDTAGILLQPEIMQ